MSDILNEGIRKAIEYDGFREAEQLIGKSYKECIVTKMLGMSNHLRAVHDKAALLEVSGDISFGMELSRYLEIIESIGFEQVYEEGFRKEGYGWSDRLMAFYRRPGVVLHFDTYHGNSVNSGKFHYNLLEHDPHKRSDHASSGGYHKRPDGTLVWCGDHDCREAVKYHIRNLEANGVFLAKWEYSTSLWITHYADDYEVSKQDFHSRIDAYYEKTEKRIKQFPAEVQEVIGDTYKRLA